MTNYDELKKAAEAATLGEWKYVEFGNRYHVDADQATVTSPRTDKDAKFIALANPTTILALLAEREKLLKVVEAARELTATNFTQGAYKVRDALKELEK